MELGIGMNEKILVVLVVLVALGLLLYNVMIAIAVLGFSMLLLAFCVYSDNERREESLGILEARINTLAEKVEKTSLAGTQTPEEARN